MGLGERVAKVIYRSAWYVWASAQSDPAIDVIHRAGISPNGRDREFVHRVMEPAVIEPKFGYVITRRGQFIEESLAPNFDYEVPKSWRIATPAPWRFLKAASSRGRKAREFDCVVSLRHLWEWNYYHFYLDVLGKLDLLETVGIDPSIPVVLGKYAYELPFVRDVISRGQLGRRNWILPSDDYIYAKNVIYCRTGRPYRNRLDHIRSQMEVGSKGSRRNDRLFLTRGQTGTRRILNEDAVRGVLAEFDFVPVDTSKMAVEQQIELFSGARYLVASHGAGIANILYRGYAPISVLELHGRDHISQDFWRICIEYDNWWDHLSGDPDGPDPKHANFEIPIDLLRAKLSAMFAVEAMDRGGDGLGSEPCVAAKRLVRAIE